MGEELKPQIEVIEYKKKDTGAYRDMVMLQFDLDKPGRFFLDMYGLRDLLNQEQREILAKWMLSSKEPNDEEE